MKPRERLRRIRANLTWFHGTTWFYNLDNYRADGQVKRELTAIASLQPEVIALVECIGNEIPELNGYRLVRDSSTRSRQNIAAYLCEDLPLRYVRWVDLNGTWPRTEGSGTHEARSYLVLGIGWTQTVIAHQPPRNARDATRLQREGIDALVSVMAPRSSERELSRMRRVMARLRPRLLVWDANRRSGEAGPGPDSLAKQIRGTVHGGERIDSAVTRGRIQVLDVDKQSSVAGVHLESDHRGAVRFRWRVRSGWLRPRR